MSSQPRVTKVTLNNIDIILMGVVGKLEINFLNVLSSGIKTILDHHRGTLWGTGVGSR